MSDTLGCFGRCIIVFVVLLEVGWLLRHYAFALGLAVMALTLVGAVIVIILLALPSRHRDHLL
jgi:hypothetical protein